MRKFKHAREALRRGETGLVLYTDGSLFEVDRGSGWTGNWRLSERREFDSVVIYKRERADPSLYLVYTARATGTEPCESDPTRRRVRLRDVRCVGYGTERWQDFASSGRGPLRYLEK